MTDLDALEAAMHEEQADQDRRERAQARVDALNTLSPAEQRQRLIARSSPAGHAAALLTLRLHGRPGLHNHLAQLEQEALDAARP